MHINKIEILFDKFPTRDAYPFNLEVLQKTPALDLTRPVTFFVGENGSGKSTLLQAIAERCCIYRWRGMDRTRYEWNPYEDKLHRVLRIAWSDGQVPGSYFCSQCFQEFAKLLDQWACNDPGLLEYFGGKSLMTQSHGQVLLAFFQSRYQRRGLYLLDEPENALSPQSQLALLKVLVHAGRAGYAQFLIATHSPILLSCPEALILSFDKIPIQPILYEKTEHYQFYQRFMNHRHMFLKDI